MSENRKNSKLETDKFKEMAVNDYQYYDRRYDTVSMVIAGFGLYGCSEILKWYLSNNYEYSYWLSLPIILWLIIVFLCLYNIGREKRIREYYMMLLAFQLIKFFEENDSFNVLIKKKKQSI